MTESRSEKQKILLHACCGPCAIYPLERLLEDGHEPTMLWYNPNIHPLQEYLRRREGARQVAEKFKVRAIFLDDAHPGIHLEQVIFRENRRCLLCYRLRLEKTLKIARRGGFDALTSTLLYSRQQKHDEIRSLLESLSAGGKVDFLYEDYRLGWKRGIDVSHEWGVYRQQYCGCIFSEYERFQGELRRLQSQGL
jgi:hypothetical protein